MTIRKIALLCLLLAGMTMGCKKNSADEPQPASAIDVPIASQGWRMDLFMENGRDQSVVFKKYLFRFLNTEVVTATDGKNSYSGRWTTVLNDAGTSFIIKFGQTPFIKMNGDWEVIRMDTKTIRLKRLNANGGGDGWDYLTFSEM